MNERYSIEVNDEIVEIYGDLTIEEAFDFLSFFERKGYKSVVLGSENSTLRMMKRDQAEVLEKQHILDILEEKEYYKDCLKSEQKSHEQTSSKLKDVEKLMKQLMSEEYERYKRLKEENDKLIKAQLNLFLHEDPRVQEILKSGGHIGCTPPGMGMGDKGPVPHPEMFGIDEGSCGVSKTN